MLSCANRIHDPVIAREVIGRLGPAPQLACVQERCKMYADDMEIFPLDVSDGLVGEEGDAVVECPDVDEAHGFLVAGLAEQALADPEGDREDLQPQLVD